MTARATLATLAAVAILAGCATPPPAVQVDEDDDVVTERAPLTAVVEYPPIEPVEPPPVVELPVPAPPEGMPAPPPAPGVAPEPVPRPEPVSPAEPSEEQQLVALLADLQRYGTLSGEDAKRELNAATQLLARQRTDINRVRLAVLFTVAKTTPQDDQRALQLLDNVAKGNPGSPAVKQLAAVLQVQIVERARAVRDEQQKADAAIQKLEALRAMERSLLRDRIRSGGGAGGGGSAGGGGGAGGGGR